MNKVSESKNKDYVKSYVNLSYPLKVGSVIERGQKMITDDMRNIGISSIFYECTLLNYSYQNEMIVETCFNVITTKGDVYGCMSITDKESMYKGIERELPKIMKEIKTGKPFYIDKETNKPYYYKK